MRKAWRIIAILAVLTLVAAACGNGDDEGPGVDDGVDEGPAVKVGLVYDIGGRGDLSFNDAAAAGLDQAVEELNVEPQELEPDEGGENRAELMRLLADQDHELIIGVGFLFVPTVCQVATEFPDVNFADVDGFVATYIEGCEEAEIPGLDADGNLTADSNVVSLLFAEHEGSFLVGAAAALKSESDHIGFIGGVEIDLIKKFEAGFVAGAQEINPDIEIDISYISQPPDFRGFNDPAQAKEIAAGMFDGGADVVYHAAGGSGLGLFEAAREVSDATGTQHWAIGVDSDQYLTAPEALQPYILTSMLKRVDVAVYETIKAQVEGNFTGGYQAFGLAEDGVGYSPSGGFVDDIADQLEELKQRIIDGEITVPEAP